MNSVDVVVWMMSAGGDGDGWDVYVVRACWEGVGWLVVWVVRADGDREGLVM